MADINALKVMIIYEAGARLDRGAELLGLACHIYHRFYRLNQQLTLHDMYTFAAACIQLASWFYEQPISSENLTLVMASLSHNSDGQGDDTLISDANKRKVARSIDTASKIIAINLDFQINYKDTRMLTPGEVLAANRRKSSDSAVVEIDKGTTEEEQEEEERSRMLVRNNKHQIGSHRYLVHYLKTIQMLVPKECLDDFNLICNVAWTFLTDFHWVPHVTQHYSNNLACACLMMAIETFKEDLANSKDSRKVLLWSILDKKWNLILNDDFSTDKMDRLICTIVRDYDEYERILQHELSIYVIDPRDSETNRARTI